jgi:5-methylcytosine-specific restriction endonuclease McrBC GTP-binding regulatory subunit McrB
VKDPLAKKSNLLFVPVRPDWRDGKSLLGYYNPLTQTYEWTEFLYFILKAANDYRNNLMNANAWFVILDEMNLARVEYYFSDLLSIIESGRDEEGWTKEPLRFNYSISIINNPPPDEFFLPPNLYIIGTVNVDETTYAFSPKVLDRAFTIELTEADFENYPIKFISNESDPGIDQRLLLNLFSNNGDFTRLNKELIANYVEQHGEIKKYLQNLNQLLRSYDLHFGYRVFDEIIAFLDAAERNQSFNKIKNPGSNGMDIAFDVAVLMKVLPKFHGSRGKLERPLIKLLAWCIDPENIDTINIDQIIQSNNASQIREELEKFDYKYKQSAGRTIRLLWSLYTMGFAAFS